jgi:hypothetical protein
VVDDDPARRLAFGEQLIVAIVLKKLTFNVDLR